MSFQCEDPTKANEINSAKRSKDLLNLQVNTQDILADKEQELADSSDNRVGNHRPESKSIMIPNSVFMGAIPPNSM